MLDDDFERLCHALYATAYRASFPMVRNSETAQDIAQESLARAWVRWGRVQQHAHPWVARVAMNLSIDELRRKPPPLRPAPDVSHEQLTVDRLDLYASLRHLSKRQREAVYLRHAVGLSEDEVGGLLRISPKTVKTHVARGLANLRVDLERTSHGQE